MTTNIETRAVAVGGLTFDVDMAGPANGAPVLMLHGFPQTKWSWRRQLPALAGAGFRGVAPSQRGYSPNARPTGTDAYAATLIVDDALLLMNALEVDRFHLVGHDWGGQIAWMLAARAPERLLSLTVLSRPHPGAFVKALANDPEQASRSGHHASLLVPGRADVLRKDGLSSFKAMFARQGVSAQDADAYCATLAEPGALEAAIEWYRASASQMRNRDFPKIAVRTLYLWGDADATVGRMAAESTGEFVAAPYRFVEIPGVGHFVTDQAPDVVNRELLAHLSA